MSVSIANAALDRVFAAPITSLNNGSQSADVINRHINKAAELVLRETQWSESKTNTCLDRIKVCDDCHLPDYFCYAFALPKDFIRAYRVHEDCGCHTCDENRCCDIYSYRTKPRSYERGRRRSGNRQALYVNDSVEENWRIMQVKDASGQKIDALLLPCPSGKLEYVCMPEDIDALPIDMTIAIELMLAYRIAPVFKANSALRREIMEEYRVHMQGADFRSAGQDQEEHYLDCGEFVEARYYVSDYRHWSRNGSRSGNKDK